jgi:hypothetical protein
MGFEFLVIPLAFLCTFGVGIGFFVFFAVQASDLSERKALWQIYAQQRNLAFMAGQVWVPEAALARAHETRVSAEWLEVLRRDGKTFTCASVTLRVPALGSVVCTTEGTGSLLLDDESFDHTFATETRSPELARRLLSLEVRRALQAFRLSGELQFRYERGRLSLLWSGSEQSYGRLDEARALLQMAGRTLA